jgi:hypothetical protein
MANIFVASDNSNLIERIQSLTPESKPLWGKMNVSQMLLHAQKPLDVAQGKLVLKRGLIGFLFGKMAKNSFMKADEFKKSLPTVPQFKITDTPKFEKEKQVLISIVQNFGRAGTSIISNKKHPFFGELDDEEWGILQYKHLDHHLKQFGV